MNIRIIVNSQIDLKLSVAFNNLIYDFKQNTLEIANLNECPQKIIFFAKIVNRKKYNYSFYLHKKNSYGLFQWAKEINELSEEIVLPNKPKRNLLIKIDIDYVSINNYYNIDEHYLKISNITINRYQYNNTYKKSKIHNKTKIIDNFLLIIKNLICLLFGGDLCHYIYNNRFSMRSIFNGEMIWVDIFITSCAFISYVVYSFIKKRKFDKRIDSCLRNSDNTEKTRDSSLC